MADSLHEELTRTLATAADYAPGARPDLLGAVERRYRRRRRNAYAAVAGATVLVLAGGYTVAADLASGTGPGGADRGGRVSSGRQVAPARTKAVPVEKALPSAVRDLPVRLPNGRVYRPWTLVDSTTLLATVASGRTENAELWLYNFRAGTARLLAQVPDARPDGQVILAELVTGGGQVAWATFDPANDPGTLRVWSVPLAGGVARAVTVFSLGNNPIQLDRLAVAGGTVYWSLMGTGGVFRAPVTGGTARPVAGTAGYHLVAWPWVGTPGEQFGDRGEKGGLTVYRELRNLQTGERRTAVGGAGDELWQCGVTRCVGRTNTGRTTEARNRDGSLRRVLPGDAAAAADSNSPGVALDRFVILAPPGKAVATSVLYDLATGRTYSLGTPGDRAADDSPTLRGPDQRLLTYAYGNGQGYRIVDLAAIR